MRIMTLDLVLRAAVAVACAVAWVARAACAVADRLPGTEWCVAAYEPGRRGAVCRLRMLSVCSALHLIVRTGDAGRCQHEEHPDRVYECATRADRGAVRISRAPPSVPSMWPTAPPPTPALRRPRQAQVLVALLHPAADGADRTPIDITPHVNARRACLHGVRVRDLVTSLQGQRLLPPGPLGAACLSVLDADLTEHEFGPDEAVTLRRSQASGSLQEHAG